MQINRRSPVVTYGFAILIVAATFSIRLIGWSILGQDVPFLFFFLALTLAAWFGGFGPGVFATGLSTLIVALYFLPPVSQSNAIEHLNVMHLSIFVVSGIMISWLIGKLHASLRLAEGSERKSEQRAAEAEEGKRILEALMECVVGGIAIVNAADGRILKVSDFWCKLVGRERKAVEGTPLESLLDRRHKARQPNGANPAGMAELPLIKALRGGEAVREQEWSLKRAGGESVPVLCSGGPIRDRDGNIIQGVIAWSDITERKHMEEELRRARADLELRVQERTEELAGSNRELVVERSKLLNILGAMHEAVYIVNHKYQIEYANPAMERQYGPLGDTKCHEYLYERPDPCPWCKNDEVFAGKSFLSEWTSPRNNRVYDVFDTPIVNHDGSISKLRILHDVTEHKQVQERLRYNEGLLRKMLETLPVGVWIIDKDGKILEANPHAQQIWGGARFVGIEQYGEFKGWRLDTGAPISGEEWAAARAVREGLTTVNQEAEIECFDGTRKIIINSAAPVRSDSGELVAVIAVNHDITALKRAEEERAREQQQLKSLWKISRNSDLELKDLHNLVLAEMLAMTQSSYGFFGFPNEDESVVTIHAWSDQAMKDCRILNKPWDYPVSSAGLWCEAVRTRQPLIVNDYQADHPQKKGVPEGHVTLKRVLAVPIMSRGRVAVIAAVANKEKEYTDEDAEQINAFVTSVQVIVERKKAEEALVASRKELQRVSGELLTAQESERMRISRELHDELGQTLTLIKLWLGMIEMNLTKDQERLKEYCRNASSQIDDGIENMRRLSRDLCPATLESLGVTAALRRLAQESARASNMQISTEMEDIDHLFSSHDRILLYRVIQETLTNIMKHSAATKVNISAKEKAGRVLFQVHDDGKGIELEEVQARSRAGGRGLGLTIMRERLRMLGASLEISSQKGMGTRLNFSIPTQEQGEHR